MEKKCKHKGCGKTYLDDNEDCIYHPGPPEFHEGQKGWKCCKPRVLTFDEFLSIPPCTTGKHTTIDESAPTDTKKPADDAPKIKPISNVNDSAAPRAPKAPSQPPQNSVPTAAAAPESDSDDPAATPAPNVTCKRRGCNASSPAKPVAASERSEDEQCVYHPGQALFHEGSKGWTCCKKRVLEFDEFMKISGCKKRPRHCFVGKKGAKRKGAGDEEELEKVENVRHDFYQTGSLVHASLYLKKIDKEKSSVVFEASGKEVRLDLKTGDGKWYSITMPLFGSIDSEKSTFKILGTKLDLTLAKADGAGWPVLRSDEKQTGEIIQTGRAGRA